MANALNIFYYDKYCIEICYGIVIYILHTNNKPIHNNLNAIKVPHSVCVRAPKFLCCRHPIENNETRINNSSTQYKTNVSLS